MAVNTWDGAVDTDWNDAGNWNTTGVTDRVPTSADNVVIPNVTNKPVIPDSLNPTVLSIEVEASSQLTCGANTITCTNERTDYAFSVSGTLVPNTSTVVISSIGSDTYIKVDNGTLHNLTINSSGDEVKAASNLTLGGALTITAGELDILTRDLTVSGNISGNGTLTCNASTVTVTGQTTVSTFNITSGTYNYFDDFRPTTANITDNATFNQTSTGGQFGGRVIIGSGKTPTFNAVGRLHNTLDIRSGEQGNSTFNLDLSEPQTSGGPARDVYFYNLELDSQGTENNTYTLQGGLYCTGTLTITDGIIDTKAGVSHAIQVTKHLDIGAGGTLTGRGSSISTGTMTIRDGGTLTNSGTITVTGEDVANSPSGANWLWRQLEDDGTGFAPTAGTVHFNHASNLNGKHLNESKFYNLTLTAGTGHDVAWTPKTANTLTVSGDLTIVEGQLKRNVEADTLVVTEDVSIESGGVLGDNDETGPNTFGSLTIASGGTYKATSGTTTITSMTSTGSGDRSLSLVSGGTFTNNSGTVLFNGSADQRLQMAGTGNLYNLTVNKSDNEFVTFGNLTIENNLDVTLAADHTWRPDSTSDTLTVHGNTYLTTGRINNGSTQYAGTNNWGNVTINSGEFVLSSGTNNFTGIRNIGGTVSQS